MHRLSRRESVSLTLKQTTPDCSSRCRPCAILYMARILRSYWMVPLHLAEGDIAMPQLRMFTLLVVIAVGCAIPQGHSEGVRVKHVLTRMPVAGHLTDGGTFAGRLTVEKLTVNDLGQLAATGVLTGTAT